MELKEDHLQLIQIGLTICIKILKTNKNFILHWVLSIQFQLKIITKIKPDEACNLAAQYMGVSFKFQNIPLMLIFGRIKNFRSN